MIHLESKALKQLKNFNRLSSSQLDKLAQNLTVRVFKKDETFLIRTNEPDCCIWLSPGVVRVSYNGHDRQTIVSLLPPGEFFGVDSLVPDSRHPFRCDAFDTSTIGSIKPQVFVETLLGTAYEDFLPGFVASLNFTRQAYIHCIRGIGLDVRRRIALELSNLADRFGSNDSRGILISLAISHETLAGIVGASRQQVTEYLNEFDREKIILREGRRIIVNLKNLRKVIENRP